MNGWRKGFLVSAGANVRSAPSMEAEKVALMPTGPVLVGAEIDGWKQICVWTGRVRDGKWVQGWVAPVIRVDTEGIIDMDPFVLGKGGRHVLSTGEVIETDRRTGVIRKNEHIWQLLPWGPYYWFVLDTSPGDGRYFRQFEGDDPARWMPRWWKEGVDYSIARWPMVTFYRQDNGAVDKTYGPVRDLLTLYKVHRGYTFPAAPGVPKRVEVATMIETVWHNGDLSQSNERYRWTEHGFSGFYTNKFLGTQRFEAYITGFGGELKPAGNWPGATIMQPPGAEPQPPVFVPPTVDIEEPPTPPRPPAIEPPPVVLPPEIDEDHEDALIIAMLTNMAATMRQMATTMESMAYLVKYRQETRRALEDEAA